MTMNSDQISKWGAAGLRGGFDVTAPCKLVLSNGSMLVATALIRIGPRRGMVVDPQWSVLERHAEQLVADGFGYSAVTIEDDDLGEMLRDWRSEGD